MSFLFTRFCRFFMVNLIFLCLCWWLFNERLNPSSTHYFQCVFQGNFLFWYGWEVSMSFTSHFCHLYFLHFLNFIIFSYVYFHHHHFTLLIWMFILGNVFIHHYSLFSNQMLFAFLFRFVCGCVDFHLIWMFFITFLLTHFRWFFIIFLIFLCLYWWLFHEHLNPSSTHYFQWVF